jgi:hypothetical protein
MARRLVKLAIFLLLVHALYRFVPVYFHYQQFKDAVHETALFSRDRTDAQIIDRVMELAEKYEIPLSRDYVQVRRENERTMIDVSYVESIEWLPTYTRPWQFDVGEEAFTNVRPSAPADIGR